MNDSEAGTQIVIISPSIVFLDNHDLIRLVTGGRTARTLWDWNKDGLAIHKRGEGSAARYFILVRELETFLLDTSRVI